MTSTSLLYNKGQDKNKPKQVKKPILNQEVRRKYHEDQKTHKERKDDRDHPDHRDGAGVHAHRSFRR